MGKLKDKSIEVGLKIDHEKDNAYFNKKGDDIDVRIPEKKQLHGKKSKKRK